MNGEKIYSESNVLYKGTLYNDYLDCYHSSGDMQFIIFQPAEGVFPANSLTFNNLLVEYNGEVYTSRLDAVNASSVTIAEFDMENRKASGSFYFEGRSMDDSTKTLLITDGVFHDFYFPDELLDPSEQFGHLQFNVGGTAKYYYQIYNFGDDESIVISGGEFNEHINISHIPLVQGIFEIDSATEIHASYNGNAGLTYFNALTGSQVQVTAINTTEKSAELNFTLNLADEDGNEVHLSDGYAKVYY